MSGTDDPPQRASAPDEDRETVRGLAVGRRVFGRYTLEHIAGRGGMGVVWRARDEELERTVALKFLPAAVAADVEAVRDLKRETKRCLELTHPHIVRVYDFVQDPAGAAIAMEFVDGESLAKRKAEKPNGCLSVAEVESIAGQLCSALDYAHQKAHIIHRDLKPANLLVTREGDLKVMDFGIARSLTETRTRLTANAAGGTSGTMLYMSPQQLMGEKPCVADDIYALGATLYELLAGKPPFYRGDGYALMTQIREKPPLPLAQQRAELEITSDPIPRVWEQGILSCLAKNPQDRPHTAGELAVRLGVAVTSPLPGAGPRPAPPVWPGVRAVATRTTKKYLGRPRQLLLAAGVLLAAAVGYYYGVERPEQARLAEIRRLEEGGKTQEALRLKTARELAVLKQAQLAAARGGIIIHTEPIGATVTVGAIEHGVSPLTLKEVKLGKYPVRARAAGYEDWTGEVEVKENEFSEVNARLERSTGNLVVSSEPAGLEVEVTGRVAANPLPLTGRQVLRTPQTLKLATGSYTVVFRRDGWLEQGKTVEVARNQSTETSGVFVAGKLVVTSEPAGADVLMAGKSIGVTPLTISELQPGTQTAELRLKGYKPATVSGLVTARATLELNAVLEQKPAATGGFGAAIGSLLGGKPDEKLAETNAAPGILNLIIRKAPPGPLRFTLVLARSDGPGTPMDFPIDEAVTKGRTEAGDLMTKFTVPPGTYTWLVKSPGYKHVSAVKGTLLGLGRRKELSIKPGAEIELGIELEPAK